MFGMIFSHSNDSAFLDDEIRLPQTLKIVFGGRRPGSVPLVL